MVWILGKNEIKEIDAGTAPQQGMDGQIVCAGVMPFRLSEKLWALFWAEFVKNGRKILSPGKIKFLRRKELRIRKRRLR